MKAKVTSQTLRKKKEQDEPLVMVTAYDYPAAKLAEEAGVDLILVGDSVGTTVLGYESTIPVTLEDMLHHTKAVTRAVERVLVVTDLPFAVAHRTPQEVIKAAARLMQEGGCYGVKIEGDQTMVSTIDALTRAGIPVMGHIGLTPQSVNQLGGYRYQGKEENEAEQMLETARELEEAGIFALVMECVPEELAELIAARLSIPVIGIGSGRKCDGQVLVYHDILQLGSAFQPSFVKSYASLGKATLQALQAFTDDVRTRRFPGEEHVTHLSPQVLTSLLSKSGGSI